MKWRNVNKKFPKFEIISDDLLLLHEDGIMYTGHYQRLADERGLVININNSACPFYHRVIEDKIKPQHITHWMPLPKVPDELD